jgi:hypothetical protein
VSSSRFFLPYNTMHGHMNLKLVRLFFANDQLEALFFFFFYYISLHVSSITVLVIRRSNCINTSSVMMKSV